MRKGHGNILSNLQVLIQELACNSTYILRHYYFLSALDLQYGCYVEYQMLNYPGARAQSYTMMCSIHAFRSVSSIHSDSSKSNPPPPSVL